MKVNVEKIEKSKVALEIEVDAAKFSEAVDKAYRKLVKKVNVPGFRKGKAPRKVLERHIGKEALYDEALEIIIPDAYMEAVEESQIEPIDSPEIEIVNAEEREPLVFKARVDVKPEVTLGQYKELEVEKPSTEVSEDDVNNEIENLRRRHAKLVTLEGDAQAEKGDIVNIDFQGFVDDVAFPGGEAKDYPLELGSNTFIPGFEDQLVGVKTGEEKDIKVKFPDDYHAAQLAGKDAVFKVRVNSIKRKEYAEIDDEFAKDVSEFETLQELKEDILNRLKEAAEKRALADVKSQAIEKATKNAEVEIPEVMVRDRINQMINSLSRRLHMQGMNLDTYLKYTNTTLENLREQYKAEAEESVKTDLVLQAIAKKENIQVTEEEINAEIDKLAKDYNQKPEAMRTFLENQGNMEAFKEGLMMEKAIDLLVKFAKTV